MMKKIIWTILAGLILGQAYGYVPADRIVGEAAGLHQAYDTIPPLRRADFLPAPVSQRFSTGLDFGADIIDNPPGGTVYLNLFEMMQGRVPGMRVIGSYFNYKIRIRGAMGPPLVVVDGMPFYGADDQNINQILSTIAPIEVDQIEVIKNMGQASLYGPGAANGVILVKTRRGEEVEN